MINFQGNWVDLVIIVFVISYLVLSFEQGFLAEFFETLGFLISLFAGLSLFSYIAPVFVRYFTIPHSYANAIGFFAAWILIETIYYFMVKRLFRIIPIDFINSKLNRYLVFLPSLISSLILAGFILTLFIALPTPPRVKDQILKSETGSRIIKISSGLDKPINRAFGQAIQDSLTFLTVNPQSHERVDLGFSQKEFADDLESENTMLQLLNHERETRGLKALQPNNGLREVAREHSKDMMVRGYFSHYSPEGKDVANRLDEHHISYLVAGENLAYAPSINLAHQGLMNSSGHRANILSPDYGKVGLGVIDGGIYGKMVTQVFTN